MYAMIIAVLAFVITMMLKIGLIFDGENNLVNSLIMICALIVLLAMGFSVGYYYIYEYFIYKKFVICDFGEVSQSPNS